MEAAGGVEEIVMYDRDHAPEVRQPGMLQYTQTRDGPTPRSGSGLVQWAKSLDHSKESLINSGPMRGAQMSCRNH